jgi:hypothetical protein
MTDFDPTVHTEDYFAKRKVPAMVAYISPFRLVDGPDSLPWEITIEQVNKGGWDYVALHELVGHVDVGLAPPYHMVIARDGAVALPPIPDLRDHQEAVEFFNRCFAALLLGGIYCEAIGLDGLDFGSVFDWKYVRSHAGGTAEPNRLHHQFRMNGGSPLDTIALFNPRKTTAARIVEAIAVGRSVLGRVPEVSGEFLLKGVTAYAKRDWGTALANLWIVVEQLSSHMWAAHVLAPAKAGQAIPGRTAQLEDYRTWTTGARLEVLHQLGKIPAPTLISLTAARKARNDLAHDGKHPTGLAAKAALDGALNLLQLAVPDVSVPLLSLNLDDHALADPFERPEMEKLEPTHWMEIPKLPGEQELEQLAAQFHAWHARGDGDS